MEIIWYGHSCFRLTERDSATVITDPFDHRTTGYTLPKLSANIVTVSHSSPGHNCVETIKGDPYIINSPGEYEVGGVFITGIQMGATKGGDPSRPNILYTFGFDTLSVAHLGNLYRLPTQAEVEEIGTVNVALVPVENGANLSAARVAEAINLLEPNIVIPMHYDPLAHERPESLTRFLKEMGLSEVETQPSLKVAATSLPEETKVVILEYQRG